MSVRTRLTVTVALVVAALATGAALFAPSVIERVLVDDLLDADAALQADYLFADGGTVIVDTVTDDDGAIVDQTLAGSIDLLGPDEVITQLGDEELARLIAEGGSDDLIVALGGAAFVTVDAAGAQTLFSAELDDIDQPVLTFFELFQRGPTGNAFDLVIPDEFIGDDGFIDESTLAALDDERVATGVREVDGTEYYVSSAAGSVDRTVARVRSALWTGASVAVVLAGLAAWLLAGRALRPVRAITDQTSRISAGTLDERVPVPQSGDEIATLASTMNGMLDRLEGSDRRRRRFVSDASHELRSPVAVLRSEAEVALRTPDGTDVEQLATGVLDESTRMATIIDDLLALARHDEGVASPASEIDLDDIVLAEAQRSRRVPVDATAVSAGRVRGRHDEFSRMVAHLLDNGARHAASEVRVALANTSGRVVLTVDDDGPGVPEADRVAIFERFTRLDEARTRDRGGAGLGLSVVASIVQASCGTVAVTRSALGGARFVIDLPAD